MVWCVLSVPACLCNVCVRCECDGVCEVCVEVCVMGWCVIVNEVCVLRHVRVYLE